MILRYDTAMRTTAYPQGTPIYGSILTLKETERLFHINETSEERQARLENDIRISQASKKAWKDCADFTHTYRCEAIWFTVGMVMIAGGSIINSAYPEISDDILYCGAALLVGLILKIILLSLFYKIKKTPLEDRTLKCLGKDMCC